MFRVWRSNVALRIVCGTGIIFGTNCATLLCLRRGWQQSARAAPQRVKKALRRAKECESTECPMFSAFRGAVAPYWVSFNWVMLLAIVLNAVEISSPAALK